MRGILGTMSFGRAGMIVVAMCGLVFLVVMVISRVVFRKAELIFGIERLQSTSHAPADARQHEGERGREDYELAQKAAHGSIL